MVFIYMKVKNNFLNKMTMRSEMVYVISKFV